MFRFHEKLLLPKIDALFTALYSDVNRSFSWSVNTTTDALLTANIPFPLDYCRSTSNSQGNGRINCTDLYVIALTRLAGVIFCWLFVKIMTSLLEVVRCVQKGSIKMQPWKWTKDMATTYSHLSKDLITDLGQSIKANANGTGLQTGFCQWHPIHKFQSASLCLESVENAR